MSNCINCSFSLELNVKFCPECGTKQPEASNEKKEAAYSASIGDKNVISGNIIGKSEEFNITGPATINKIEDETKKFITCAVSGKHLLRGRDIVVNCPNCKSDVSQESFNLTAGHCLNCDNQAYLEYSNKLDYILADGIIEASERIMLDSYALSLKIESNVKYKLETEAKDRKANANLNAINNINNELSGFHKIEFNRALKYVYEEDNLEQGFKLLNNVFLKNSSNDEVANIFYLLEAILLPETAIANYHSRNIDRFWQHYWAFLPHLKKGEISEAYEIIENNKNLFADKNNDVLISEVAFYLICYFSLEENSYLDEAKSIYDGFSKNVKEPLLPLVKVVDLLIIHSGSDYFDLIQNTDKEEMFILGHIFGLNKVPKNIEIKENVIEEELQIEHHKKSENLQLDDIPGSSQVQVEKKQIINSDFNIADETWVDKDLGLVIKRDKLFFIDSRDNNEYPIFFTDSIIWIGRNLAYLKGDFTIDNSNPTASCVYNNLPSDKHLIVPKGWYMPPLDDWNRLSNFIAVKSGNKQEGEGIEEVADLTSIHPKIPLVKNFGINYKYANFYIFDISPWNSFSVSKNNDYYFNDKGMELAVRICTPLNKSIIDKLKELNFLLPDYINYEDIRIIVETKSSIDINNLNIGSSVSCINNKNDDRSTISELEKGSLYTISEINVRKNIITLQEYPQQNNSEKKKWFNISLFNLAVNNNSETEIEEKITIKKTVIETPKGNQNVEERISIIEDIEILDLESVCIGSQEWLKENLNIDKFRNGDIILESKTIEEWEKSFAEERPSWCYYSFDPKNAEKYGKLYNMFAVHDPRELAPKGWQIPNQEDWEELIEYSGGKKNAGLRLKSKEGWNNFGWGLVPGKDGNGINRDGFSAKPGGAILAEFYNIKDCGYWWSKPIINPRQQISFIIGCDDEASLAVVESSRGCKGFSVRCVKEKTKDKIEKYAKKNVSNTKEINRNISTKELYTTTIFNSGEEIPIATNFDEWLDYCEKGKPVMCFNQFNSQNHTLYNFYAIISEEGIVPPGYRLPRTEDEDMLGDNYFAEGDFEPGILEVGLDPSLNINRKRFKNKIAVWQAADQEIVEGWDDIGVVPIGGYVFELNAENELEQINVNGYWGYPILLIPENE